jgi:hypothetical protein
MTSSFADVIAAKPVPELNANASTYVFAALDGEMHADGAYDLDMTGSQLLHRQSQVIYDNSAVCKLSGQGECMDACVTNNFEKSDLMVFKVACEANT